MCYSRNCRYENYWGECERPKHKPCPHAPEEEPEEEREEENDEDEDDE